MDPHNKHKDRYNSGVDVGGQVEPAPNNMEWREH